MNKPIKDTNVNTDKIDIKDVVRVFYNYINEIDARLLCTKPLDDMEWREYRTVIGILNLTNYLSDSDYQIYREKLKNSWIHRAR
jgi:hypothetical protein